MRCIVSKDFLSKIQRKVGSQKHSKLPSLNARDQKVKSPTKMRELASRMTSPVYLRKRKNISAPIQPPILTPRLCNVLDANTSDLTEEQSMINEKAKMRVLEARMSRFTGFKSPRILINKLISRMNTCDQNQFNVINSIEVII